LGQPETVQTEDRSATAFGPVTTTSTANGTGQAGLVNSATGAAGALAGWAIASIGKQLSTNEVHSSLSATPASSLAPTYTNGITAASSTSSSPRPSTDSSIFASPNMGSTSKLPSIAVRAAPPKPKPVATNTLKLGGVKAKSKPNTSLVDTIAGEWDDGDDVENAWGNEDLIDVNADDDDWAGFESAPIPEIAVPEPQSYYVKATTPAPAVVKAVLKVVPRQPVAASPSPLKVVASPVVANFDDWGNGDVDGEGEVEVEGKKAVSTSTAGPALGALSKEDKEKEMARRREERKARIAAMKGAKK
jgi:SCY1-like protein 1